ncbi:Thioesterase-like superfamily protein (plasmid) [Caballeronia sp. SBC1]|nr:MULTISPECIES: thioesterase family protein [unclassified Caballeronia]QIE27467.1 Thioesterase-like superfamily protein [Caballeronia sp. SBC2]QIN65527.1 Thioesterase-like superfamily protein [Caballeronia sp. SBC1]
MTHNRTIYRDTVRPEWVDYNGHLRDAFYMLIFSLATDAFMDRIGLDDAARTSRGRSLFTLEAHINYLHEIKEGTAVRVEASVLAFDAKRVHLYMEMFADEGTEPIAASEQMLLHVDTTNGAKSAAFDTDIAGRIEAMCCDARKEASKEARYAGRVIGLPSGPRASASAAASDGTKPA